MTPPLSIVIAISYAALTGMFVGMFALLAGILVRELLPGHVARRGYASEWECLRPESEARGLKLLKEWLSPAQLLTYQEHRYFEVVGCDSGTLYRIHHGTQGQCRATRWQQRTTSVPMVLRAGRLGRCGRRHGCTEDRARDS
jgi:hypothetical protein